MPESTPRSIGEIARSLRRRERSGASGRARAPRLPRPRPEREIVVRTTAPAPGNQASAVPQTIRDASEWAWRLLLIAAAIYALMRGVWFMHQVVFPVIVAVLLAALLDPVYQRLRIILPRGPAAGLTVLGTLTALIALFSFVVNQFASQFGDITDQVGEGVADMRQWIEDTFGVSESQLTAWVSERWEQVNAGGDLSSSAAQAGLTAGSIATGFVLTMFVLFFFLYDGPRIWAWVVRLFPRPARARALSSGRIAWAQLKAFTRATILVAAVDALGIGLGAFALGVPFASGIALLTFFGAFIPIIGAFVSGFIAVVLALVTQGPLAALAMLGVTVIVQQAEANLLQPLLLGRAVRVHPMAVVLGIASGVIIGGVFGALFAVPLLAVLNAVGHHLLSSEPQDGDEHPEDLVTEEEQAQIDQDVADSDVIPETGRGEGTYRT